MNREDILQILYELALVTGGETHVKPLVTKTLQKFLYHTAYPCGVFLSGIEESTNKTFDATLERVIGCSTLLEKQGDILRLPEALIRSHAGLQTNAQLIQKAFGDNVKYKVALILPVNDTDQFILLSKEAPKSVLPFERIFEPVLKNFSKTLFLCRENESYTYLLEQQVYANKELQDSLLQSRNLLQDVLNTVPSRIFWKDTNSIYLGCNSLFAEDAGLKSSNDIIGKSDNDLPWGKTQAELYRTDDQKIMESRQPKIFHEESQTRKNGTEIWLETSKIPLLDSSDKVIGILGSYTDITDRKQMEQALRESETRHRTIFASTVDGIININNDGTIESANPAVEQLFGYTIKELIGNNIKMLMPEPFANQHDQHLNHYKHTGKETVLGRGRELLAQRKDGTVFPVDIALDAMFINDKRMFTGIIRDVSDRKEAEQIIIKAKEEAERANQAKSEFLSNMSHELRTPLNAILGFGQLMVIENDISVGVKDNISEILKAGYHLLELINKVLDLAKIEAGHIDLSIEPVDCNNLMQECVTLIEPIALQNDIQINYSISTENILIKGDKTRIKQVFVNLLSNAVKYNRKGGEVFVNINPSSDDDFYRISIKDTGTGIKDEKLSDLFEAFNRLGAEHSSIEGTGIGLVITKQLVELMGGNIGVESEYGAGTTFWVEMPKETISEAELSTDIKLESNQQRDSNEEIKYKVLYIEDNPVNIKLVSHLLAKKPHIHLSTAHTPRLGLELAGIILPDLILLDIQLPDMDGFKVLENLRNNNKTEHIPVVGVSANAMPNDLKKASKAGFNDYLSKPLDINVFYETVETQLKK